MVNIKSEKNLGTLIDNAKVNPIKEKTIFEQEKKPATLVVCALIILLAIIVSVGIVPAYHNHLLKQQIQLFEEQVADLKLEMQTLTEEYDEINEGIVGDIERLDSIVYNYIIPKVEKNTLWIDNFYGVK